MTTQTVTINYAFAKDELINAVNEANKYSSDLLSTRSTPVFNSNNELMVNGEAFLSKKDLTGQREGDYLPAKTDTYGNDSATIIQGMAAQDKYEEKTLDTAETSAERAYLLIKKSFSTKKPDLTNDPMWENTDNVLSNLEEISSQFANCKVTKELVTTGESYHVPKYETCERLPALESSFVIGHTYKVGVLEHESGPYNIAECGRGCFRVWVGTLADNYWGGVCNLQTESVTLRVIQPKAITYAKLEYVQFDDYFRVSVDNSPVYVGPESSFPVDRIGIGCERSTSWERTPSVNVTNYFVNKTPNEKIKVKNETLVDSGGDQFGGEGHSRWMIYYDPDKLIYDEVWDSQDKIDQAFTIKKQLSDGYCTGHITCTDAPILDANGCTTINGLKVCESDFKNSPIAGLGVTPFCRKIEVSSDCGFNEGKLCWENMQGETHCFDNDTVNRDTCTKYENDPQCSYQKTTCVKGAEGASGNCYVQEDTYDCGFTATTGTPVEEEVITCDGKLMCVGESCYSSARDGANTDFGKVNAYLEMLKYAQADMECEGVPDAPYDEETPPDQYVPISHCLDGYNYNADADLCLKENECSYSESDFYAASYRNGIQILKNNTVLANDETIPNCVPIKVGENAYTCGEAIKKVSTDTFYEVCSNTYTTPLPPGCPDSAHIINPTTTFCEVPPTPSCPEGVPLIEGGDPWSVLDDKCLLEVEATKTCNASQTYNAESGLCVGTEYSSPQCSKGSLNSSGLCVYQVSGCSFDWRYDGMFVNGQSFWSVDSSFQNVQYYGSLYSNIGYWGIPPIPSWMKRGSLKQTLVVNGHTTRYYEVCVPTTQTSLPYCLSGFTYNSSTNTCSKQTTSNPTISCLVNGSYYDASTDSCKIEEPASISCPTSYPIWNAEEGRCESKSISPLAANYGVFNSNTDDGQPFDMTTKSVIDTVLAPFEFMLSSVVSPALAADTETTTSTASTQALMGDYVAEQFTAMAASAEQNTALVSEGINQLNVVNNDGEAVTRTNTNTNTLDTNSGNQNVLCELFKGKKAECKIAVGGMQNCCENPVAVSLGDYINLTTKMMSMDAMTGQVMGLESYTGVWDMATDAMATAYDAVFSTAADTVATEATDSAVGILMEEIANEMMQYTYEWLANTFGEAVASMFFSTATTAGGATVATGASGAMATAGAALMVVYYAYLAYVVFNLLVNIVYECEDDEMDLAMKRDLLSTHYIGSYCAQKVLGSCIEKRNSYCQFDSPLSRIMMEQIYAQPQMGLSWGTPENPLCSGVEIGDIDKVDWDKVNLDEWIGILIQTDNYTDMVDVDIESLTGMGSDLNYSDLESEARDNILERVTDQASHVDADKAREAGYDAAWEENQ
jgi:hypothetical protein